ncbi:MAG: hypothetical protein N3B12_04010 [Armatimonadetes bacterium]|nr:hypothetical protein [Armatimonadota bacterium]
MQSVCDGSKALALEALSGKPTERVPVALFTWGFDYVWKAAEIEPWKLACGGEETWFQAHIKLYERHRPDIIFYSGGGSGPAEPELLEETSSSWIVKDTNLDVEYEIIKSSLSLRERESGAKGCDSVGTIESFEDADRLIPEFKGWGNSYLNGLTRLIDKLGDHTLVLPHHSPAYICACYAFGFERAMEAMCCEPELFRYTCDKYASGDQLRMRELRDAGAEAVFIADAWASCDIISPALFDKFALPYQDSITKAARAVGLKVILWNEGNVIPILDREAALQIDAFAVEQPRKNAEVTLDKVRAAFGPNRCLFGNLDSEELLRRGSPKEIEAAVQEQMTMSGKGAPFVLCTGSPIPSDVDPKAVDTMIDAARDFRW